MRRATRLPGSFLGSVCFSCILASTGARGTAAGGDSTNFAAFAGRSLTLADARRQEARIAEVRQRVGDISRADQNQIEITAERLELDAAGAEAESRKARVTLEVLLGDKEPRGEIELADGLDSLGNVSTEAT